MYIFKVNHTKGAKLYMKLVNQSKNPHAFKDVSDNETTIAMVIWLLSFFTTFLGPLIIWVLKEMILLLSINKVKIILIT